tara:strand:+ start:2039 stop:2845 length:807 start_codon:yes stop_codon:yes gene_type:complete
MLYTSKLENVTVGADPEVFVATSQGDITSAIGHVGGSKIAPRPVKDGGVQEDNVLAEFNINPAKSKMEFVHNMNSVMDDLKNILDYKDLQITVIPSYRYTEEELQSFGPSALEFGCSSEWNAWTEKEMNPPRAEGNNLRTAGGHVHIGYDNPNPQANLSLIKMLDFAVGLPSVLVDTDKARRKMYGKAGSMRNKVYGVEYRTLSNFWLNSNELMSWVYDRTIWATQNLHRLPSMFEVVDPKSLRSIINNSKTKDARSLINELHLEMVS